MEYQASGVRVPFEDAARKLNARGGLYLSEAQQRGLALGLFVGAVAAFAGLTWSLGAAYRRYLG